MSAATASPPTTFVPATLPIDAIAPLPDSTNVALLCGELLFRVPLETFTAAPAYSPPLNLADAEKLPPAATGVERLLSVSAGQRCMLVLRDGVLESIPFEGPPAPQRILLPGIRGAIHGALLSDDGRRVLLLVRDDGNPHFCHFDTFIVEPAARKTTQVMGVSSDFELVMALSTATKTFVAFDPYRETVWRIDSDARTLVLATRAEAAGRSVTGMLVNALGNAIALVYQDVSDGRSHLRLGQLSRDGVQWQTIVRVPEGLPRLLRWRPTDRQVAYERGLRRRSFLEIIDAAGKVVSETELPRRWQVNDLAWTPDGKRLLAAGNDGVLVWNCE